LARSNLRSRELHEIGQIGRDIRASVSVRPLLGILAERSGLIAKKDPPRLCWPPASCRHVARDGRLRDRQRTTRSRHSAPRLAAGRRRAAGADRNHKPGHEGDEP
jgi:hypothetical protein